MGSGIKASHNRCCRLQGRPNYDVTARTLVPGSLPARICSALWFNNTSPLGDRGRVLGGPHSQQLRFQARLLRDTFRDRRYPSVSVVRMAAPATTEQSARIVVATKAQKIKCLTQGNKIHSWELPEYKFAFLIPKFLKCVK